MEQGGKALAACLKPIDAGEWPAECRRRSPTRFAPSARSRNIGSPIRPARSRRNPSLGREFLGLWAHTLRRMSGETDTPFVPHDPSDKRFAAPEWRESPYFDFLRQAHAILSNWAADLVERSDTLDPHVREKAKFYFRQLSSAFSPSNFLATNPELIRETWASNGENLVRGAAFLAEDIEAGGGTAQDQPGRYLEIRDSGSISRRPRARSSSATISSSSSNMRRRPRRSTSGLCSIIPPWINKFYILDLNPEKSFVRFRRVARPHGLHDLLGQSRHAPSQQGFRELYARRDFRRARCDRRSDRRERRSPRSAIASAAPCLP